MEKFSNYDFTLATTVDVKLIEILGTVSEIFWTQNPLHFIIKHVYDFQYKGNRILKFQ